MSACVWNLLRKAQVVSIGSEWGVLFSQDLGNTQGQPYFNTIRQPNQTTRHWCFFSSIMWLNCVWTLAPQTWTVVNYWNKKHRGIHFFCENNKIFHINWWSISWALKWIKYVNHSIKPVIFEPCHLAQYPFVAYKLLLHPNKEMTLGIMIWFFPPLSNEYISLIQQENLFYILSLAWSYKQILQDNLQRI